jgi:hypothetical protein
MRKFDNLMNLIFDNALLCLALFIFFSLIFKCSSTQKAIPEKLDLAYEKQVVLDSLDIPKNKKDFIIRAFDKSENYCNEMVVTVGDLHKVIENQKQDIETLDAQASIYRKFRDWLIGISLVSVFAFLFYQFRGVIVYTLKRLVGLPL